MSAVYSPILFILAGNEDMHKSLDEFEFWPDLRTDYGVSCPWAFKKSMSPLFSVAIDPIHFKFIGNKDMHIILNEFEFRRDRTTNYGVICPWTSKKYPHRLIMGKMVSPHFLVCFRPRSDCCFQFDQDSLSASFGPITLWKNHTVKSILLLQKFLGCPNCFSIFIVLLQEQPKILAFDVLWLIYHNDPNFFQQSALGKHCRPRPDCFWRRGAWSQSTPFVIQFAGITLWQNLIVQILRSLQQLFRCPNFSDFCCECGRF